MISYRMQWRNWTIVIGIVASLLAAPVMAWPAVGMGGFQLSDALAPESLKRGKTVSAFRVEGTGQIFRVDQSNPQLVLVQEEGSDEIWALHLRMAPRGERVYVSDTGREMLRINPFGGITVYPASTPMGLPAYELGPTAPIPLPENVAPEEVDALRAALADLVGGADTEAVQIAGEGASPGRWEVDMLRRVYLLFSADPALHDGTVHKVMIVAGDDPDVVLNDGSLTITIDSRAGYRGRPSLELILQVLQRVD